MERSEVISIAAILVTLIIAIFVGTIGMTGKDASADTRIINLEKRVDSLADDAKADRQRALAYYEDMSDRIDNVNADISRRLSILDVGVSKLREDGGIMYEIVKGLGKSVDDLNKAVLQQTVVLARLTKQGERVR